MTLFDCNVLQPIAAKKIDKRLPFHTPISFAQVYDGIKDSKIVYSDVP